MKLLFFPIALVFHALSRQLYWADTGKKTIESISVNANSNDRRTIITDVEYPYAFTIWDTPNRESILYYTDQVQEQLVAFNLKTSEKRVMKNNVANIMQLKLYQTRGIDPNQGKGN